MKLLKNILLIVIPLIVSVVSATVLTNLNLDYPKSLVLPPYYPPEWLFGVVWTIVFILIAISSVIALTKSEGLKQRESVLSAFNIQLILNFLWTVLFFGARTRWIAFAEILLLTASIIFMIITYKKVSKISAWLLAPYILWVLFAAFFLNLPIAIMN